MALEAELSPAVERLFASEAFGSPQLMQSICLNLCYLLPLTTRRLNKADLKYRPSKLRKRFSGLRLLRISPRCLRRFIQAPEPVELNERYTLFLTVHEAMCTVRSCWRSSKTLPNCHFPTRQYNHEWEQFVLRTRQLARASTLRNCSPLSRS